MKHSLTFNAFDLISKDKNRYVPRLFFEDCPGLVFVVDSTDRNRIQVNFDELNWVLSTNELRDSAFLILANKQDDPEAMSLDEITEKLGLNRIRSHKWHLQGTCAVSGDGVYEGFEWLVSIISEAMEKR